MSTTTEQRIFISYRRSDCQSQANGLNDGLRHRFPEARVFMDIDSIPIGADFEEHIRGEIEQCNVALILIGDNWLDPRPGSDVRRIDEGNDFVRLEVESALAAKHLRVIPVLVEGARMPTPDELPKSIRRLARLNAFELSDHRWSTDVEHLTRQLRELTGVPDATVASEDNRKKITTAPAYVAAPDRTGYSQPSLARATVAPRPAPSPTTEEKGRSPKKMILWSVLTVGLAAWTAPIWAANRRPSDTSFRKRMHAVAAVLGVAALVGFALVGSSPEDADGTPTGAGSDIGTTILMLVMAAGVAIILVYKKPQVALAGTESVLARRDTRERYRQLIDNDRPLARSMHVGRPDVARDYDDGGLLDLNSVPPHALAEHGGLSHTEAAKVVEMRGQLGRYVSMDELLAYVDLPEPTASRLRDIAVFV